MKLQTTILSLCTVALATACSGEAKQVVAKTEVKAEAKAEAKPAADKADAKPEAEEGDEGCIHEDHKPAAEGEGHSCGHGDATPPAGDGHFGGAFTLAAAKPLSQSLTAKPDELIQVSGQIDKVCQKMGCWMVIKDGEAQARILMKDHSFTVPMDSTGKAAVVEGTLESRTFTEKQVKHLEKDGGGDPSAVGGERTEYVLTAAGVNIKAAQS